MSSGSTTPTPTPVAIPVSDASFEGVNLGPPGGFTSGSVPGWVVTGGVAGVFEPTGSQFPGGAPDGVNVAYSNGGVIAQTLTAVLAAGTYTLQVGVGARQDTPFPGYGVQLWAGSTLVAQDAGQLSPPRGMFATSTVSYTAGAGDPSLGQPLSIRLTSAGGQTDFDNVRLTGPLQSAITVTSTTGLVTTRSGGSATFTVVLDARPTADVTVPVASSNAAEGTVSASSLTFTPSNWSVPQLVTVVGVNDHGTGGVPYTILVGPSQSADPKFNGTDPSDVPVVNTDVTSYSAQLSGLENSYDNAWLASWVAHSRSVYTTAGKTSGFVLEIGDSISHSVNYSAWPLSGAGQTPSDAATVAWAMGNVPFSAAGNDTGNKNGWYLADARTSTDPNGTRGMTAAYGLDTADLLSGAGNGSNPMPAVTDPASARATLADGSSYTADLQIDTIATAFNDAQFAVLMLGTNDLLHGRSTTDFVNNLSAIVGVLESHHIVVILSTIPPIPAGYNSVASAGVVAYNNAIRGLAQDRDLALIDFYQEILSRRPGTTWNGTLLGANDIHPSSTGAGYNSASDPYAGGGDPVAGTTGAAAANVGYLLRSWLTIQKLKEIRQFVTGTG